MSSGIIYSVTASFECRTRSSRSPAVLFDLARDIGVHTASQAAAGERAVSGVVAGRIGPGEEVTWRARHFGVPFSLTSRVTEFDAPRRFVDEQVRGPFASFHHEHLFETDGAGCAMIDRITYTAPFGPLGRLVERTVLTRRLRRLIEERGRFLAGSG